MTADADDIILVRMTGVLTAAGRGEARIGDGGDSDGSGGDAPPVRASARPGAGPALRAARLNPVEALRAE